VLQVAFFHALAFICAIFPIFNVPTMILCYLLLTGTSVRVAVACIMREVLKLNTYHVELGIGSVSVV